MSQSSISRFNHLTLSYKHFTHLIHPSCIWQKRSIGSWKDAYVWIARRRYVRKGCHCLVDEAFKDCRFHKFRKKGLARMELECRNQNWMGFFEHSSAIPLGTWGLRQCVWHLLSSRFGPPPPPHDIVISL